MMTQNYCVCQAIKRAVQTFLGMDIYNVLEMNRLKFGSFQTFFGGRLGVLGILPPISSYPKDVVEAFLYSKHPRYR